MKKLPIILTALSAFSLLTACNTVPEKGEQGVQGEKGDKGDTGEPGLNGKDGSKIYTGEDVPSESLGVSGDLYIDTQTGNIYLKGDTWTQTGNIKGDTGEPGVNGKDGSKIYTGEDVPSESLGVSGDLYIDTKTWNIYLKGDTWTQIGNIKGDTGEPGVKGKDGSIIYSGEGVPNVSVGAYGDLYIDIKTWNIYLKGYTWTLRGNIKGDTGETGAKGDTGATGVSIVQVYIDNDGNLICKMSDGSTINAGQVEDMTQHTVKFYVNNSLLSETKVKHGNKVSAPDVTINEGYEINEWYTLEYNHKVPWSFTGCTVTEDVNLYLDNTPIEYNISYYLYGGYNDFDNPDIYTIVSDDITLKNPHKDDYYFVGWYSDKDFTTPCSTITNGSTGDKAFYAKFIKDEEAIALGIKPKVDLTNKTVTYGLYPQTYVSDTNTIAALNKLKSAESNGYYLLNGSYYAMKNANPADTTYTFDNNTKIVKGTDYWFKCEPITWNILSSNNGTYSLLSNKVLNATYFASKNSVAYDNSNVRAWLKNNFYTQAFSLDESLIQTVEVDNSAETTISSSNTYVCDNTEEKIYLLSYQDYLNADYGFGSITTTQSSSERECQSTDYARACYTSTSTASATKNNAIYWTRSHHTSSSAVSIIGTDGSISYADCGTNSGGVRPAITIKIA